VPNLKTDFYLLSSQVNVKQNSFSRSSKLEVIFSSSKIICSVLYSRCHNNPGKYYGWISVMKYDLPGTSLKITAAVACGLSTRVQKSGRICGRGSRLIFGLYVVSTC
jgi:hypothetical protein